MSRFVRASKYRHVYGQTGKKEYSLENVKVTTSAWDTNLIATSGQYLSLNWAASGGGAFAILPLPSPWSSPPHYLPYKLPDIIPLARGHSAPVTDTAWSPFDDSVVASGGEDGKILIWKVEPSQFEGWGLEKWVPVDFDPVARMEGSGRKVGQLEFHPTANHVLASASGDYVVRLWDLNNTDDARSSLVGHTDTIQGMAFNSTGTLLVTTCRDRKLRLFDPRAGGEAVRITDGHGGIKGSRVVWMGERDNIATTGFSKMSDRQVSVWETGGLENIKTITLDQSSGVVMPFWSDNNILFLAGKGDGNIRYYEYESDSLHALSEHKSSDPQRGMCFLPRRALNVSECEIMRAYKVFGTQIEPIAFVVPRKSDSFQSDIFPPAAAGTPALSASEFFSGKTARPNLVNLDTGSVGPSSGVPVAAVPTPTVHHPTKTSSAPPVTPALEASPPTPITKKSEPLFANTQFPASPQPAHRNIDSLTPLQPSTTPALSPASAYTMSPRSAAESVVEEENNRLTDELRTARTQIRNLELQVETMKANAQRAAKVLLDTP